MNGACPECETGTRATNCEPDAGTRERHRTATTARHAREDTLRRLSDFEAYYAARGVTEPIDSLELWWELTPVDPEATAA